MIHPKPEIINTAAAYHGAFDYKELRRLQVSPDEVIDFSVNSNPYGSPSGLRVVMESVPLDRYPDRECLVLRETLMQQHGVPVEQSVFTNGTAELLLLIAQAFIRAGDDVVIQTPSFSEYERVSRLMGAQVHLVDVCEATIQQIKPRVVFICHPNNPTGALWDFEAFQQLSAAHQDTLFVVDEAYINFALADSFLPLALSQSNILLMRSLTKDFALAGLRLGYGVGHPDLIEAVRCVRPAWNVNAFAQAAGVYVLNSQAWLEQTITQLHQDKCLLVDSLNPLPSATHYFLLDVGDGAVFRSKLLAHKIMVRDCASFGLPSYVRIATRTPADNHRLLEAIAHVC